MAFEFYKAETDAAPIEKEVVATNGVTYNHGCLLVYGSAGTVTTTTAQPEFVYTGKTVTAKTGDKLAVNVVLPEYEYITTLSASGQSLKAGWKVTTDGEHATATSVSGIFELLTGGGASGSQVVGRFS